jgi:hypothetical protein
MLAHMHPSRRRFTCRSRPGYRAPPIAGWLNQTTRCPEPLCPQQGVTSCGMASSTTSEGITPPSSLLWAHAPDQIPPPGFGSTSSGGSLQVVTSPCWEMAFPDVISAILTQVPGPLPRDVLPVHMLISSRQTTASRKD